jgi:hypothetical protein
MKRILSYKNPNRRKQRPFRSRISRVLILIGLLMLLAFGFGCSPGYENTPEYFEMKSKVDKLTTSVEKLQSEVDSLQRGKFPFGKNCLTCPITQ